MNVFESAAEVKAFLEAQGVPYAVIGGLAVQYWGEPRATRDVDVVIMEPPEKLENFLNAAL